MPIFEFTCPACNHPFEELCRAGEDGSGLRCPQCSRLGVRKRLSTFSTHGLRMARPSEGCGDCPLTDCTSCPSASGALPG